jgi:hypothetical protein
VVVLHVGAIDRNCRVVKELLVEQDVLAGLVEYGAPVHPLPFFPAYHLCLGSWPVYSLVVRLCKLRAERLAEYIGSDFLET